jgi:hypothetical protein
MKQTKILMCALAVGAVTLATSNVFAVQGTITVSGTALSQNTNNTGNSVAKKNKITQKGLLQILEQATGDTSITNKKTVLIYVPDAFNTNSYYSNEGAFNVDGGFDFYGIFYYSNSVAGLQPLDGIDESGDYKSYMELDYYDQNDGDNEGFWNAYGVEYNSVFTSSKNKQTSNGNAILYIHSNPYDYNLPGSSSLGGQLYFANDFFGASQAVALVFHGTFQMNMSRTSATSTTFKEAFKLSGSGDGLYDYNDLVVSGKASFKGIGLND